MVEELISHQPLRLMSHTSSRSSFQHQAGPSMSLYTTARRKKSIEKVLPLSGGERVEQNGRQCVVRKTEPDAVVL